LAPPYRYSQLLCLTTGESTFERLWGFCALHLPTLTGLKTEIGSSPEFVQDILEVNA
jgi:hypothetical protein